MKNKNKANKEIESKETEEKNIEQAEEQKKPSVQSSDKYKYLIKNRQVRQHTRKHKIAVSMLIFLGVTIVLGGLTFGMISFLQYNNFKVLIDKQGMNILTLSSSKDFAKQSEVLSLDGPRYMDNITLMDIYHKIEEFKDTEGNYGKRDEVKFMAATFYLKNISESDQIFREAIIIDDITKNVDDAIRIMVIREDEMTVYAKPKADGGAEEVVPGQYFTKEGLPGDAEDVWMSEPFISPKHVFYNTGLHLKAGEVLRYTVVVWLEGWDPECVDEILGGTIKMELQFAQQ